ncbi:MAG: DUF2232 domain-containing protein [Pseudomonadota bacterium]|nr:DUF2232 domain-containing protein [Pseudomonadota bacterium]
MRRELLFPLGAGVSSALLFLSPAVISLAGAVLVYFAPLPLAMTGFALGYTAASIAAAVSALSVGYVLIFVGGLPGLFTVVLVTMYVPVLLIVFLGLKRYTASDGTLSWYPAGNILNWLTILGLIFFLTVGAILAASGMGFKGTTEGVLGSGIDLLSTKQNSVEQPITVQLKALIPAVAQTLPSTVINTWMVFLPVLNCIVAQRLVLAQGKNLRPTPEYKQIQIPIWLLPLGCFAVFLAFFSGEIAFWGLNIFLIVSVPFFFIGLSVMHSISAAWPGRAVILTGIYLFLVLMHWPALILVTLGAAEYWLRLRRKMNTQSKNKGNE